MTRNPLRELKSRWVGCMNQNTFMNNINIPDYFTNGMHNMSATISSDDYLIEISISKRNK